MQTNSIDKQQIEKAHRQGLNEGFNVGLIIGATGAIIVFGLLLHFFPMP